VCLDYFTTANPLLDNVARTGGAALAADVSALQLAPRFRSGGGTDAPSERTSASERASDAARFAGAFDRLVLPPDSETSGDAAVAQMSDASPSRERGGHGDAAITRAAAAATLEASLAVESGKKDHSAEALRKNTTQNVRRFVFTIKPLGE
jgi:hypothetical protein